MQSAYFHGKLIGASYWLDANTGEIFRDEEKVIGLYRSRLWGSKTILNIKNSADHSYQRNLHVRRYYGLLLVRLLLKPHRGAQN